MLTTQEIGPLLDLHRKSGALATVMLTPYPSSYGVVDVDSSGKVLAFREKEELPHWINAGVYVLDTAIREELPILGDHETETFPPFAKKGRLYAYQSRSFWKTIDTHKDLREAEMALQQRAEIWESSLRSGSSA